MSIEKRKYSARICDGCGNEITEYNITKYNCEFRDEEGNVLGSYEAERASCPICGESFVIEEIRKENAKKSSEKQKELFNIPSYKDIQKLPRRYNIPRKYFEKVLNIKDVHKNDAGQLVPFNIWEGDALNYEEHQAIVALMNDPNYYIELLNAAKEMIPQEIYEKSLERAKGLANK